jgi:sugar-specific transcriptional regulator TrmB
LPRATGTEERIVRAMKQIGFTESHARAYLALLKGHPATGYELAARSGVPRSAIYQVLKRLDSLGLVDAVGSKPAKYVPLSPDRLFELMESRFSSSLEELKSSLSQLTSQTARTTTLTIQGYPEMLDQARGLIEGAKKSLHASLWRREAEQLAAPLRRAADSGLEVVLFSFTALPAGAGRLLEYGIRESDLERYWSRRVILISDLSRALVGGAEETEDNRVVLTEESTLVEMAISNLVLDVTLYGQRTGTDITDVITGLTARLAPVEELVALKRED